MNLIFASKQRVKGERVWRVFAVVAGFEKPQGIKCFKDSGMALRYVFALHKKYNAVMPRSLCLKIARQAAEEKKALKE